MIKVKIKKCMLLLLVMLLVLSALPYTGMIYSRAAENQAESSKLEELPKADLDTVKVTGKIIKYVEKLLLELHSEDPAQIASKVKELNGVKDVIQNGYYLKVVFDTGIIADLMISTEDSPRTQMRGGEIDNVEVYGKRVGDGDTNFYSNKKIIEEIQRTEKYNSDKNCSTSSNSSVLIWAPFHSEWEGNDEIGIAKTVVENIDREVKLDIIRDKAATANSLKKMSNYGIVILATHGNGGEWILTSDMVTEEIKPADAQMLLDGQKKIVIRYDAKKNTPSSRFAVTHLWIKKQMKKKLPGTIVVNNSCESLKTDKLWNAFKKKGAATYFGYSGNVRNEFAVLNVTSFLIRYIGEGLSAFQSYGYMDDYYYESSGSHFIARGQGNIRIDFDYELKKVDPVYFSESEQYMGEKR